jgi:tetratricopeptide (TPR) repeat protein
MLRKLFVTIICLVLATVMQAQEQLLLMANQYLSNKDYPKATELFLKLYTNNPNDKAISEKYFQCLLASGDLKNAEKLAKQFVKANKKDVSSNLMLAQVYALNKEEKKYKKLISQIIEDNCVNDAQVRATAAQFEALQMNDNSIALYEQARKNSGNPLAYAEQLATLYDKKGDFELATDALLDLAVKEPQKIEDIKAALLRLFNKPDKVDAVRKKIIKRINAEPDQITYPDVLGWLFIQQNDYEEAFIQYKAIDARLNENGKRVLNFARTAAKEKQYNIANDAFEYVLGLGKEKPLYFAAYADKISSMKSRLVNANAVDDNEVDTVLASYQKYFTDNPNALASEIRIEYAMLLARYARKHMQAIKELSDYTKLPNVNMLSKGKAKLDLGDYYLIDGNNWEASLIYSQVDKDFKNDALGEEARFRNAKLSYYMHDYVWAQGQLDILKASTSELIANDALNLSVLITENKPYDSVFAPLDLFANADLLLFQNKTEQAILCLDTISGNYPENALVDDVLMLRGRIASRQKKYEQAVQYFTQVYTKHGDDVLADDAVFQAATIQEKHLNNLEEAKKLFEKIILDYPGSTFVTEARKNYRRLRGDKIETE